MMTGSHAGSPAVEVRVSGEGWLTYAVGCAPAALPPVLKRDLDAAWHAARVSALAGDWGAVRGFRFAQADGGVLDIALSDRDARCWAGAVDSRLGLGTRYGISVLLRLLALVNLIARAAWSRPLCHLARDGAELHPLLLAAAATQPLDECGQFDETAFRRRLPHGAVTHAASPHSLPDFGPGAGAIA